MLSHRAKPVHSCRDTQKITNKAQYQLNALPTANSSILGPKPSCAASHDPSAFCSPNSRQKSSTTCTETYHTIPSPSRREALASLPMGILTATITAASMLSAPLKASAAVETTESLPSSSGREEVDTTITHAVALTIGIAATALKQADERRIGDKSIIPDAQPIGQVVIGLYGNAVPRTVSNFLSLVASGNLVGTTFSRVLAGEYIQAGKQGSRRLGAVEVPPTVQPNSEMSEAYAFRLPHYRPGTVSLALGENDEEPTLRQRSEYKPVEFLITTGPGPVPRLNGQNIVFGRVLEGMSVVGQVATVPVFGPSPVGNSLAFNSLASAIGDERAATVRRKYGKPLKAVVILGSEILPEVPQ